VDDAIRRIVNTPRRLATLVRDTGSASIACSTSHHASPYHAEFPYAVTLFSIGCRLRAHCRVRDQTESIFTAG
jgi:hypothetical protein